MARKEKILIIGGYGGHNWGDDCQLYNNIRLFRENGFEDITVLTPQSYIGELCSVKIGQSFWDIFPKEKRKNDRWIKDRFTFLYRCAMYYDFNNENLTEAETKLLELIRDTDILFVSGCGMINTRHIWGLAIILFPIFMAELMNKKVVLSGQGVTPISNHFLSPYITLALNNCDKIFLRDFKIGSKTLKNINILNSKIGFSCDDAYTTPRNQRGLPDIPKNSVAINISHYSDEKLLNNIVEVARQLKKDGFNPIFNYFQDEEKLVNDLVKDEFPIISFNHPEELAWFFSQVVGTICMRYHAFIYSLAGLTPVINIYTNEYQKCKIQAIQENYNFSFCMIESTNVTPKVLYEQFQKALIGQVGTLVKMKKEWEPISNMGVKYITNELK